jgi:hypothetical protein
MSRDPIQPHHMPGRDIIQHLAKRFSVALYNKNILQLGKDEALW